LLKVSLCGFADQKCSGFLFDRLAIIHGGHPCCFCCENDNGQAIEDDQSCSFNKCGHDAQKPAQSGVCNRNCCQSCWNVLPMARSRHSKWISLSIVPIVVRPNLAGSQESIMFWAGESECRASTRISPRVSYNPIQINLSRLRFDRFHDPDVILISASQH